MQDVRIVIYGVSLVLAAVEAALKPWTNFSVVRVDPTTPQADAQVQLLQPHIVIVDGHYECVVVCPKTILRVDRAANNHAAIFNEQVFPIQHIRDLANVIQRFVNEQQP